MMKATNLRMKTTTNVAAVMAAGVLSLVLSGCSLSPSAGPNAVAGPALHGNVHGGQQPVNGARIRLYAVGATGYGVGATYATGTDLLGSNVVTTDALGNFNVTGDYTCPTSTTPVYLVATGGQPTTGVTNNNLAMMIALGPCTAASSFNGIQINELSTIGSVWPLSGFMTNMSSVGTSATNSTGLANAFAGVNKLISVTAGTSPGPALPAGASVLSPVLNSLADIMQSCINSAGGVAGDGSACGNYFAAATPPGGTAPTDTIMAALNIAQNPGNNVSTLFLQSSPQGAFQPTLGSAPNAWTIAINYVGGGLSSPSGIATDASGNVWLSNKGNNSVTQLSNTGAAVSGAGGFTAGAVSAPTAVAVDQTGKVWVTNGNNTVTQLSSNGSTGTAFGGGGLNVPTSISIDGSGNVWVANAGNNSATELSPTGTAISPAGGYAGGGASAPIGIAVSPR